MLGLWFKVSVVLRLLVIIVKLGWLSSVCVICFGVVLIFRKILYFFGNFCVIFCVICCFVVRLIKLWLLNDKLLFGLGREMLLCMWCIMFLLFKLFIFLWMVCIDILKCFESRVFESILWVCCKYFKICFWWWDNKVISFFIVDEFYCWWVLVILLFCV